MDIDVKLAQVCDLFRIEGTYVGHETIQVGNVNKTYEVKFILPDGKPKSFLVQNVNTRNSTGRMRFMSPALP